MRYIPSVRISPKRGVVDEKLGLLANLAGTWTGEGFNLIARPDKQGGSPLFLELNQTVETLTFTPISSSIPNRGNVVEDIELFGLTYQQTVTDAITKGALHIEEGMWVHVPSQDTTTSESLFRIGTVPHGNSLLAQGSAIELNPFNGNPFDPNGVSAVNTAPFIAGTPMPMPGTLGGFPPYDLSNLTPAAVNFRTPAGDNPSTPLPTNILGVPIQDVILDPTKLLTAALSGQNINSMEVINIATVSSLLQQQAEGRPPRNILANSVTGGNILNIPFLIANANAVALFATFWIEHIAGPTADSDVLQLQYVQTVLLNFPVVPAGGSPGPLLSWPHVSVATLRKTFGGQ